MKYYQKICLSYARYVDDILVVKMKKIQNLKNILLDYFDGIQKEILIMKLKFENWKSYN